MDSFLLQVARRIADAHPSDTDHVLVVFNNHRSLRFFQRQFTHLGRTMFLPRTMAIDDLVATLGGLETMPNDFLLFELYRIHIELEGESRKYKTFEEFIPFGDLMMGDFSEIDQYCVDARAIFGNLHDLKVIGEWNIEGTEPTPFQRDYLHFYRSLYDYYRLLHEHLLSQGKAYSGMAYRHVAEHIGDLWPAASARWEAVYFVGFNALSECERRIIDEYVRRGIGHLLTDGDPYFMQPEQEAGHFLRKHCQQFPEIKPAGPSLFSQGRHEITIVECPETVMQCKLAGRLLTDHPQWLADEPESTAVVLADESLLLPCLSALPTDDAAPTKNYSVNISMGYAFCDTSMHQLAVHLLALHRNATAQGFYHADILAVLSDRHLARLMERNDLYRKADSFLRQNNIIRCKTPTLTPLIGDGEVQRLLFPAAPLGVDAWIEMLRRLAALIVNRKLLETNEKEKQALGSLIEIIDHLADLQQRYHYIDNLGTLEKVYLRIAQRHQIPLLGEPLSGLQLMGMLETRNLDFRRVILLSAGEGVLPAGRSGNSLIPHQLKRDFHLPTYQEKDAVYAYNFYHLLLRAEEVYLVYSSESEAMGKGEPSRFLRQVESELAPRFGIKLHRLVVNNNKPPRPAPPMPQPTKSAAVMARLAELAAKGFAPTVFDDYVECPLRYYYKQVLGVWKDDDYEDDLDASQLGTAIHNVLKAIYEPYNNDTAPAGHRLVSADGLRQALHDLPRYMQAEFAPYFQHGRAAEGRNHFLHAVAESQLTHMLKKEIALLDEGHTIEIIALEKTLGPVALDQGVCIKGKVDRIDRFDSRLRIIDYKSGSLSDDEIAYRSTPNRTGEVVIPGKWFQLMCYALLYGEPCSTAIYPLRSLHSDVRLASWDGVSDLTAAHLADFRAMLTDRCRELMDPDLPFRATAKKEHCRFCDARTFCPHRP